MFIYIKSPVNKQKVKIGEIDFGKKTALFWITEQRFFQASESVGIDKSVFERSDIQNLIDTIIFKMWDGRKYQLTKSEFAQNSWQYPRSDPNNKAPADSFAPKYMIELEAMERIIRNRKPLSEREQYLLSQGLVF